MPEEDIKELEEYIEEAGDASKEAEGIEEQVPANTLCKF